MNKQRMLMLADLLENINDNQFYIGNWFSMIDEFNNYCSQSDYGNIKLSTYDCDTAGCIAGWAIAMKHDLSLDAHLGDSPQVEASDYLGLDAYQANKLFFTYPMDCVWKVYADELGIVFNQRGETTEVTNKQASIAVRKIAEGEWVL